MVETVQINWFRGDDEVFLYHLGCGPRKERLFPGWLNNIRDIIEDRCLDNVDEIDWEAPQWEKWYDAGARPGKVIKYLYDDGLIQEVH